MSGTDALMYYLDGPNTPMQTMKITVLDPAGLGREMTLDDVEIGFAERVTRYPRLRQKLVDMPAALSRPLWVDDPDFDLRSHLSEETLAEPTHEAFDAVLSRLASEDIDYRRPLWDVTFVKGMEEGRVAIAMRIHHCVTDGTSAATALHDLTSDKANGPIAAPEVVGEPDPPASLTKILRDSAIDRGRRAASWPGLIRRSSAGAKKAAEVLKDSPQIPVGTAIAPWTSLNLAKIQRERIATTAQLPLARFNTVRKAYGATINDVLLTLVGTAFRLELDRRGERYDEPCMTSFGMTAHPGERHLWGNHITTVFCPLYVEKDDPVSRLRAISKAARGLIAARKASGTERAAEWADHAGPTFKFMFHNLIPKSPLVATNVITANVKGPAKRRWAGPCEVVEFFSFAVLQPTSGLNCTVYSYAGNMNIGLLSSPDQHDEPQRFIDDMAATLDLLEAAAEKKSSG